MAVARRSHPANILPHRMCICAPTRVYMHALYTVCPHIYGHTHIRVYAYVYACTHARPPARHPLRCVASADQRSHRVLSFPHAHLPTPSVDHRFLDESPPPANTSNRTRTRTRTPWTSRTAHAHAYAPYRPQICISNAATPAGRGSSSRTIWWILDARARAWIPHRRARPSASHE